MRQAWGFFWELGNAPRIRGSVHHDLLTISFLFSLFPGMKCFCDGWELRKHMIFSKAGISSSAKLFSGSSCWFYWFLFQCVGTPSGTFDQNKSQEHLFPQHFSLNSFHGKHVES